MADLSGGGEVDNVAVADIRFSKTTVAVTSDLRGVGSLRFMPGVLGVLVFRHLDRWAIDRVMANLDRGNNPGSNDQLHSSPTQGRLANQVRGNGD